MVHGIIHRPGNTLFFCFQICYLSVAVFCFLSCWKTNVLGMLSVLPLSELWWGSGATYEVHFKQEYVYLKYSELGFCWLRVDHCFVCMTLLFNCGACR